MRPILRIRPEIVRSTAFKTVAIFDSIIGEPWSAGDDASAVVAKLLRNGEGCRGRWAVEALMGSAAGLWTNAVRKQTAHLVS